MNQWPGNAEHIARYNVRFTVCDFKDKAITFFYLRTLLENVFDDAIVNILCNVKNRCIKSGYYIKYKN